MTCSIIIGGDLCAIGRAEELLSKGHSLLDSVLEKEWVDAALRVVNLEAPLTDSNVPILKSGRNFKSNPECLKGFQKMGIDIFGLANNHILDYGEVGVSETLAGAKESGIQTVGAGMNITEASRFEIVEVGGFHIAFVAFAEHEWSIAGEQNAGANPWSSIEFTRQVSRYAGQYDRLIVLFHGGKEYYEYPPPLMQERCRFMVEQGADAVICQHSHCVGSYEVYKNRLIVYGQGNFVFDQYPNDDSNWRKGMLVTLEPSDEGFVFSFVPYEQFGEIPQAGALSGDQKVTFLELLEARSEKILDPEFVASEWIEFCQKHGPIYWKTLQGQGRILRRLNRIVPIERLFYSPMIRRATRNIIRCETLRETLLTYLENKKDLS